MADERMQQLASGTFAGFVSGSFPFTNDPYGSPSAQQLFGSTLMAGLRTQFAASGTSSGASGGITGSWEQLEGRYLISGSASLDSLRLVYTQGLVIGDVLTLISAHQVGRKHQPIGITSLLL